MTALFRPNEQGLVRLQKLNSLAARTVVLEAGGGGGSSLDLDGGDAAGVSAPLIEFDGGGV